jgi:hypothetical protein
MDSSYSNGSEGLLARFPRQLDCWKQDTERGEILVGRRGDRDCYQRADIRVHHPDLFARERERFSTFLKSQLWAASDTGSRIAMRTPCPLRSY